MKSFSKKILSVFLAFAILFGSLYAGINEIDFIKSFSTTAEASNESGLVFTLNTDGVSYSITGYNENLPSELYIPETYDNLPVTAIGNSAFSYCKTLVSVSIPASILSIGNFAFSNCSALFSIVVDERNPNYASEDGVLFNKNKTVLIQYPIGFQIYYYEIPDTVETIADRAFFYATSLTTVEIPENVKSIGSYAFYKCKNITSVTFYNTLENIGANAFNGTGIVILFYYGSITQWEETTIGSGNTVLTDATFQHACLYTQDMIVIDPTCTEAGTKQVWCTICNDSYETEAVPATGHYFEDNTCTKCGKDLVSAVGGIIQTGVLQSAHNYSDNTNQTKTFTAPGADYIVLKFNSSTYVEPAYDYIYIYDANDTQIGKYTNEQLTNKTITVNGDTAKIKLTSDSSQTYYGYYANCEGWITPLACNNHLHKKLVNNENVTCETDGYTGDVLCAVCGATCEPGQVIPALGHNYPDDWTIEYDSSCVELGNQYKICTNCGDILNAPIPTIDHYFPDEWTIEYEATCTEPGNKFKSCVRCGTVINESIPATGHDCSDEWTIALQPTCATEGSKYHACSNCDTQVDSTIILPIGHYFENDVCLNCNATLEDAITGVIKTEVLQSAHSYTDNLDQTKTFTATGAEYITVTFSSSTQVETDYDYIYIYDGANTQIGKYTSTQLANRTITVNSNTVKIRLTSDVSQTYYGYYATCTAYGNALECNNHLHKKIINISEVDCENDGYTGDTVCAACDEVLEQGEVIPAFGHSYPDEWTTLMEQTCTEDGYRYKTCSNCDNELVEELPAIGHYFENEICVNCGTLLYNVLNGVGESGILQSSHNYGNNLNQSKTFTALGANYISIRFSSSTNFESGYDKLYIYDGDDNLIGTYSGDSLSSRTIIVQGDTVRLRLTTDGSVTRYGYYATCTPYFPVVECSGHLHKNFVNYQVMDCTQHGYTGDVICAICEEVLETGEFVPSLGHVYSDGYCTTCGIEKEYEYIIENECVTLLKYLGSSSELKVPFAINGYPVTTIGDNVYSNCTSINSVVIPDSITVIGENVFRGCSNLESVVIADSVTTIGDNAFQGCNALLEIYIPASVVSIGEGAFAFCVALEAIIVDDENDSYSSSDGVLFNKEKSTLIKYPANKSGDVYTIPDTVTTINKNAFQLCYNLSSIIIPESVTNIRISAFENCSLLNYIFFIGSESDWNNITIGKNNTPLTKNAIHFNATDHRLEEVIDSEATCDEDGVKHQECSVCGYSCDFEGISATGHDYSDEWTIDIPATCTSDGEKSRHCLNCDYSCIDYTIIDAYGHDWCVQSVEHSHPHTIIYECSFCFETITEVPFIYECFECNFTVEKQDKNSYKLVSYVGSDEYVQIPSEYNGVAITTINKSCFKGNQFITTVKIPDSITTIGPLAFVDCDSLENVYIPASVTSIGNFAFSDFKGTIYCFADSVAHEYAVANDLKYVLLNILEKENTTIDYENFIIRTSTQNCNDVSKLLGFSDDVLVIAVASYMNNNLELYGTGTTITIFEGDKLVGDFTLIVEGDTNGDSICDVLDCVEVERASKGLLTFNDAYAIAADANSDTEIDIYDYQSIINRVLS